VEVNQKPPSFPQQVLVVDLKSLGTGIGVINLSQYDKGSRLEVKVAQTFFASELLLQSRALDPSIIKDTWRVASEISVPFLPKIGGSVVPPGKPH